MTDLEWTGERYIPRFGDAAIAYEHWHRYALAARYCGARRVLDLACGEGYGAAFLAKGAAFVLGMDIDGKAVEHARKRYDSHNLRFETGSMLDPPESDREPFDVVVCMEALEHIAEHDALLENIRRWLRPEGLLLVSTPDRQTYSVDADYTNPFHVRELDRAEFRALLGRHFAHVHLLGQRIQAGSRIWSLEEGIPSSVRPGLVIEQIGDGLSFPPSPEMSPLYFIAMASNGPLPPSPAPEELLDTANVLMNQYHNELSRMRGHLERAQDRAREALDAMEELRDRTTRERDELEARIRELEAAVTSARFQAESHEAAYRELQSGLLFRLVRTVWRIKDFILPQGTRRRRVYDLLRNALKTLIDEGVSPFAAKLRVRWGRFRGRSESGALFAETPIRSDRPGARELLAPYPLRVTVVIPVYDRTDILRESVRSILDQDYDSFELILACDGSPPETRRVINEFRGDPRVRVFEWEERSGGPVKGRNVGIAEARGRFVAFHDSDDVAEPDRLKVSVEEIESTEADLVYGGWKARTEWKDDPRDHGLRNGQVVLSPECDVEDLKRACVPCQSTVLARASALRWAGGLKAELGYREDHELWLRLARAGYRLRAIPRVLTNLRLHEGNLELTKLDDSEAWHMRIMRDHVHRGPLLPRVAFLVPASGISGGVAVVAQHARRLRRLGYRVEIFSEDAKTNLDWFPSDGLEVTPIREATPDLFDVLVATGWTTAYVVRDLPAEKRYYFVQSDETRFYPEDERLQKLVRETYRLDLEIITIAQWIQDWLRRDFGRSAHVVPNGCDAEIFHPAAPLEPRGSRIRVLLEGPIDVPFKGMENAFRAVNDLDCEVWCVSSAGRPRPEWKCDRFFDRVPMREMKHIYSSCDILLKMSEVEGFPGPPLEMMACGGVCVMGEVTGIEEYAVHRENGLIVPRGDVEAARRAVQELIDDEDLRKSLIRAGRETARRFDWDHSTSLLDAVFRTGFSRDSVADARA
jgi:glycosyltransferase involved in cell wall biosynthesis